MLQPAVFKNINKPTLIIHAIDDPFMTDEVIPTAELSPEVNLELFVQHVVGFISRGLLRQQKWEPRIHAWLHENLDLS